MIQCNQANNLIEEYLDNALEASRKEAFEEHLKGCPICRSEIEIARSIQTRLESLQKQEVPNELWSRIEEALSAPEKNRRERLSLSRFREEKYSPVFWRTAAAASIVILILFAGLWLRNPQLENEVRSIAVNTESFMSDPETSVALAMVKGILTPDGESGEYLHQRMREARIDSEVNMLRTLMKQDG